MPVFVCVVDPSLDKETLFQSPLFGSLESDAYVACYGEEPSSEEATLNGHKIHIETVPYKEISLLRNALLEKLPGGYFFFADKDDVLASGYPKVIEDSFASSPRASGIAFGMGHETKRLKTKELLVHGLNGIAFPSEIVKARNVCFLRDGSSTESESASGDCFLFDNGCWPSIIAGKRHTILLQENKGDAPSVLPKASFFYSHAFGVLWWLIYLAKQNKLRKKSGVSFKEFWFQGFQGHRSYLRKGMPLNDDKGNTLAFVVSIVALVGLAVQSVLSLVVTFTETQYIPIWVSLVFLAIFAVAYAIALPKVRPIKNILITTSAVTVAVIAGCLVVLLCLKVNVYLSIFGAFLCACLTIGITYCFLPHSKSLYDARNTKHS